MYKKALRMLNGVMMAQGLGAGEEYMAEGATAFFQLLADDYAEAYRKGDHYNWESWYAELDVYKFIKDHSEEISEAARIGAGMGLVMGGGSATLGYAAERKEFLGLHKYQLNQLAMHMSQQNLFEDSDGNVNTETQAKIKAQGYECD